MNTMIIWLVSFETAVVFTWWIFLLVPILLIVGWARLLTEPDDDVRTWPAIVLTMIGLFLCQRFQYNPFQSWFQGACWVLIYLGLGILYMLLYWHYKTVVFQRKIRDMAAEHKEHGVEETRELYRFKNEVLVSTDNYGNVTFSLKPRQFPVGQWAVYWPLYLTCDCYKLPQKVGNYIAVAMHSLLARMSASRAVIIIAK